MSAREGQFSKIILNLLINQVHVIWNKDENIVSLLLLNIIKTFDWMNCSYIIYILYLKRVFKKLIK